MWNKDETQGKADQIKGRVKQNVGDLTGDEQLKNEGEADEVSGKVQEGFGKGRRKVGETVENIGKNLKR